MIVVGAVLGLGLGYAAALVLSGVIAADTGIALPVSLGWAELRLVGIVALIGLALALIPATISYREPVSRALRA